MLPLVQLVAFELSAPALTVDVKAFLFTALGCSGQGGGGISGRCCGGRGGKPEALVLLVGASTAAEPGLGGGGANVRAIVLRIYLHTSSLLSAEL